jgi:hypothetical protein
MELSDVSRCRRCPAQRRGRAVPEGASFRPSSGRRRYRPTRRSTRRRGSSPRAPSQGRTDGRTIPGLAGKQCQRSSGSMVVDLYCCLRLALAVGPQSSLERNAIASSPISRCRERIDHQTSRSHLPSVAARASSQAVSRSTYACEGSPCPHSSWRPRAGSGRSTGQVLCRLCVLTAVAATGGLSTDRIRK